jgi:AcrR family transcriptional regulator
MGRPAGRRNQDYREERARLLQRVLPALVQPGGVGLSFRQLAAAVGVSTATLRHYFQGRDQLVAEALEAFKQLGLPHLHAAATQPIDGVAASLEWLLRQIAHGWRMGVGALHTMGLGAGLGHELLGPAYVNQILEPTIQATEARLARHIAAGELEPCDVRHAAIELLSPLLIGLLHQDNLHGARCRPLDLERFLADHLQRFLRAYCVAPASPAASAAPPPARARTRTRARTRGAASG